MKASLIKRSVFQYGITLLLARCISFVFTLYVIRALPVSDIGTYFYLVGISTVLEIFITWGTPVSLQTQSGKTATSNMAMSSVLLAIIFFIPILVLFFLGEWAGFVNSSLSPVALLFIVSTALSNTFSNIAISFIRSLLGKKSDIFLFLAREAVKLIVLLGFKSAFTLSFSNVLFLLNGINILTIGYIFILLLKKSDLRRWVVKKDLFFLSRHGGLLMLTFFIYTFPFIFIRVFGYAHWGKQEAGLINICLLTFAFFQLYASSWSMAIRPHLGRFHNENKITDIDMTWRATNWIYLGGCLVLYFGCLMFSNPVLHLFKLDAGSSQTYSLYIIVLLYNLIYSIGSINNSFLQMLLLTKYEITAMGFSLLIYPLIIWFCFDKDITALAWSIIFFELLKLSAQEYVLYKKSNLRVGSQLFAKLAIIIVGVAITLIYL